MSLRGPRLRGTHEIDQSSGRSGAGQIEASGLCSGSHSTGYVFGPGAENWVAHLPFVVWPLVSAVMSVGFRRIVSWADMPHWLARVQNLEGPLGRAVALPPDPFVPPTTVGAR